MGACTELGSVKDLLEKVARFKTVFRLFVRKFTQYCKESEKGKD